VKEESRKLLDKGRRALKAAETLLREGDAEFAAGRAYYAMLHTAQALLREKGLQYRRHSGVHAAFGEHFAKTGLLDRKSTVGSWMPSMNGSEVITIFRPASILSPSPCGSHKLESSGRWPTVF